MCDKDVVSFTVLGMHCGCGPPSLLCSYGVAASLFYFAALNKKVGLANHAGLPSRSFFSEKTEAGGEGSRTPVLDTFDVSISMFRRRLAALAGGPLCVSLPP